MYDYTEADLNELGWDRFVTDAWQSIFLGYRRFTTIRTLARRWSDLIQGGIGCTEDVADELVRAEIMMYEGRAALPSRDPMFVLNAMDEVLADMGTDLAAVEWIRPGERDDLLARLERLRAFVRHLAVG
jgi:hypothetical protein